jgi:hypothetical protein
MSFSKYFRVGVIAIPLILLALYFFHPIPLQGPNVDLGHHLLLGKITVENLYVPQTNFVSFTHPEYVFINNQWLSEVMFYLVFNISGFNGLIILAILLVLGISIFISLPLYKKGQTVPAMIVGLFYLQMVIDRTEIKPELISFLLLSIFLFILYQNQKKPTKWIYILPLLSFYWVNFHIFFIVGLAVLGLFSLRKVFVLSVIATFINPNFIKGVIYPLHVLGNYGYEVIENLNLFSAIAKGHVDITFFYFLTSVCLLWLGILIFRRQLAKIDIYLSLLFTFLGIFAVRNFPLFAIGTFIPAVNIFSLCFRKLKNRNFIYALLIILISPAIIKNFQLHGMGFGTIDNANKAIDFFLTNSLHGPVFNNYNIGNYLEYRLYPLEKVFVDGNPEQYPAEFFIKVYYPIEGSFSAFSRLNEKYGINVIFYEHKNQTQNINPLLTSLVQSPEWKMVYLDSSIVIFVKNADQNRTVIRNFEITPENIHVPVEDLKEKDKIGDWSNFFRCVGWYHQMMEMDLAYLQFDPKNCTALRHISVVMTQENNPVANKYLSEFNRFCN